MRYRTAGFDLACEQHAKRPDRWADLERRRRSDMSVRHEQIGCDVWCFLEVYCDTQLHRALPRMAALSSARRHAERLDRRLTGAPYLVGDVRRDTITLVWNTTPVCSGRRSP